MARAFSRHQLIDFNVRFDERIENATEFSNHQRCQYLGRTQGVLIGHSVALRRRKPNEPRILRNALKVDLDSYRCDVTGDTDT